VDTGSSGGAADVFRVTRLYSNLAAKNGMKEPCVPALPGAYFGAAVEPTSLHMTVDSVGNGTGALELEPFALGSVGKIKWFISAGGVTFAPSHGTNSAGERVPITVTAHGAQSSITPSNVYVTAQSEDGRTSLWNASLIFE